MPNRANVHVETTVSYEQAGVQFNVSLRGPVDQGAAFKLTVDDLANGQQLPFTPDACAAVADFVRGYTRWLGTKGIRATLGPSEVTGTARNDLSVDRLYQVAREATDMVDQRFPNYKERIVGSRGYSDITYEKRDGVAWLLINRPEVYNAKRGRTMNEMAHALLDAAKDNSVRAVVVSGAGPNAFCSGNDQSYDPYAERDEYAGTSQISYSQVIRHMPQPVIAMVDGYAIGSGNILAYQADFTIASTRSIFGQTGPRVGSPAAGHGVAMLAARVGQKRAREIWMLCQQYSAQEAYDMGLVNKVVPPDQLQAEVEKWIGYIKNVSPTIVQMQKISFTEYDDHILPEQGPVQRHMPDYAASEEARERRMAFIERRRIDPSKNLPYIDIPIQPDR